MSGCSVAHAAHELALGGAHVEQRLPGLGVGKKMTKYTGMSGAQRDADLRVVLEAADAGAVAAARIDDDVGRLRASTVTPSGGMMRTSA